MARFEAYKIKRNGNSEFLDSDDLLERLKERILNVGEKAIILDTQTGNRLPVGFGKQQRQGQGRRIVKPRVRHPSDGPMNAIQTANPMNHANIIELPDLNKQTRADRQPKAGRNMNIDTPLLDIDLDGVPNIHDRFPLDPRRW